MPKKRGQTPGGPLVSRVSNGSHSASTTGPGAGLLPPIRLSDTPGDAEKKRRLDLEARRLPLATINTEVHAYFAPLGGSLHGLAVGSF